MGKLQRGIRAKKVSIDLFVAVFNHLIDVHREREKFALSWIWNDDKVLKLFLETVLGIRHGNRDMLRNGYYNCRENEYETFSTETWGKVDEVFLKKRLLSHLPKPVRHLLELLQYESQTNLCELLRVSEVEMSTNTTYSYTWIEVFKVPPAILKEMQGCFLGEWSTSANDICKPEIASTCRAFPLECLFATCRGNLTHFYERQGNEVKIIAVHLKGALEHTAMSYLRTLMEELFVGHPKIVRRSMATLQSYITSFEPFWQQFESGGGTKVSFESILI